MQILKVASSQGLTHKVNSSSSKGDLFAQIFENMIKSTPQLPEKIATVKNHHPAINFLPANIPVNNLKLLKKIPVKHSLNFKKDEIVSTHQKELQKPKILKNQKNKKNTKPKPANPVFSHLNETILLNQNTKTSSVINKNSLLNRTQKTDISSEKQTKPIETSSEQRNNTNQIKILKKNSFNLHQTRILTENIGLKETSIFKKKPIRNKNIQEISSIQIRHIKNEKTVGKIDKQINTTEKAVYFPNNAQISNQKKIPEKRNVSLQSKQIQFIPVRTKKEPAATPEIKPGKLSISEDIKPQELKEPIEKHKLYHDLKSKKEISHSQKAVLHFSNLESKKEPISTQHKNQKTQLSTSFEKLNNDNQTQNINSSDKNKNSVQNRTFSYQEKNAPKIAQHTPKQNQFKNETLQAKYPNHAPSGNNNSEMKKSDDLKTSQKLVINTKNKIKHLSKDKIKKLKTEHPDKVAKPSEHLNKPEKVEEIIIENSPVQPLKTETTKDRTNSSLRVTASPKENFSISNTDQSNFSHDNFSDIDLGIQQQHRNEHIQQENIQEYHFQKQLSLNLRLENISLRATYHNGNLNLFMSVNESQLLNSLKTEIPGIMKETGIKEYNLRIKSKEKEIRIFSKQKNYNTQSASREINVRV